VRQIFDFAVLGYFAGRIAGTEVPVFEGIDFIPTIENLKALGAALASSGAVALFHIVGVTPEAPTKAAVIDEKVEAISFGPREYQEVLDKFSVSGDVDFVVTGCPHCSIIELGRMAELLTGKKVKADLWVCTSRQVKALGDKMGFTEIIEASGARIVCDTCPVLAPTSPKGYKTLVTNSGKLAHYAPGLWNLKTGLVQIEDCVTAAIEGRR
jgi:predicted aconitase